MRMRDMIVVWSMAKHYLSIFIFFLNIFDCIPNDFMYNNLLQIH